MTFERKRILEELEWHFDSPSRAYLHLTDEEKHEILKKGHVTKVLRDNLESRLASEPAD
jgi:hypothetical protein